MGMPAAAFWLLGPILAGASPGQGPAHQKSAWCVSSSKKRTWQARSRLFYTPPTRQPPDVPPGRPLTGSPL